MQLFVKSFIVPLARKLGWKNFCEIGASTGDSTNQLLRLPLSSYAIVDPCFDEDLPRLYGADPRVTVHKCNSLDALRGDSLTLRASSFHCILIDGDHNWYTVINELRLIHQRGLLHPGGMIFLHDIDWPYGRRDLYYQPDTIPAELRHSYANKGMIRGEIELAESGGQNPMLFNALHEGGPRNGVLTAVEDFLAENPSAYHFCRIRLEYGLGILQSRQSSLSGDMSFFLLRIRAFAFGLNGRTRRAIKRAIKRP